MPSGSRTAVPVVLPAQIIPSSRSVDGLEHVLSEQVITYSRQPRRCVWCWREFAPKTPGTGSMQRRFCGTSCSAKWRMTQPEVRAKVHNPEVSAKVGKSISAWWQTPGASAQRARISALNPMTDPAVREKVSRQLKAMKHGPSVRGGNGKGLTKAQSALLDVLGPSWCTEWSISLGQRMPGYPTHYKLDLARPDLKIGIEADGNSHYSRKEQDRKKDEMLDLLGWTVLRFWNQDILSWIDTGMPTGSSISTILEAHGIRPSVSTVP